jgi:DNA-binding protein HU-beta
MDKKDLANYIHEQNYADTKKNAGLIIEEVFDKIAAALIAGEEVSIHGFGKFKLVDRDAKTCRNPQTGETVQSPAHSVVKFSPAKPLKDAVR